MAHSCPTRYSLLATPTRHGVRSGCIFHQHPLLATLFNVKHTAVLGKISDLIRSERGRRGVVTRVSMFVQVYTTCQEVVTLSCYFVISGGRCFYSCIVVSCTSSCRISISRTSTGIPGHFPDIWSHSSTGHPVNVSSRS